MAEPRLTAMAVLRRLAARRTALAMTAALTCAAAFFAVRAAVAWEVSLPQAARQDLRALPDAAIVALDASPVSAHCDDAAGALPAQLKAAADPRDFTVNTMLTSDSLSVAALPGQRTDSFVKVYCAPSVRAHAALDAGHWPDAAAPGAPIPVAAPSSSLAALKLHVGSRLTLPDAATHARVSLLIVGAFHRLQNPAGYWTWDQTDTSGVQIVGPYTLYDSWVADPSAFASAALHVDSSTLLVLPRSAAGSSAGLTGLTAQATSLTTLLSTHSAPYYAVSGALAPDLSALDASVTTARAQLLAAGLLLGAVTAAGLFAACGLLAGIGAGQNALRRARGAGRPHVLAAHAAELLVLCAAAIAAVPLGFATAQTTTPAGWFAAGAVAALAVTVLCIRVLRPELPAEVAVAQGRQASLAYGLRLGADVVLAVLAALALWQAAGAPLTGHGPSGLLGTDLIVAAAPALAVAAGAGLAGRLVAAGARLAERGAARARTFFATFAFWQLGRTSLGYLLPVVVTVAAVAGATFAVAQDASWRRSTRDQAAYRSGAQVVVTTAWGRSGGQADAISHAHGVLASTPVARIPETQGESLLALDTSAAAETVLLRPDLARNQATDLWRLLDPGPRPGLEIPGRPSGLALGTRLSAGAGTALGPMAVTATVQDAAGLVYQVRLGRLEADGQAHTLVGALARDGTPDYPLRLLRFDVEFTAPAARPATVALTVLSLAAQPATPGPAAGFASGAALSAWKASSSWGGGMPCPPPDSSPGSPPGTSPPEENAAAQVIGTRAAAGGGWTMDFSTGAGLDFDPAGPCTAIDGGVALNAATSEAPLPMLVTAAYLHSTGRSVGATVSISADGAVIPARIAAAVDAFPTLPATGAGGAVVNLPALAARVVAQGDTLWPPTEWWLRTVDAAAPTGLPVGDSTATAAAMARSLARDPLSGIAPRVLTFGAADLIVLAALSLAAGLAATGRRQAGHERILAALGARRGQRTAIRVLRNTAIVLPAALVGWGLGLLVARRLVPVFVLDPAGTAPLPPALFTTRPGWSALAVAVLLAIGVATAVEPPRGGPRRRGRRPA
ncbi:hypothetical protein KGA66_21085 [Actinocrinis puniceicyclus]|uniref:FtsX-like permease family protein n=1 Tax=Actinocrinis puniceicyclus TaxID=977794 RepID=A0A8J8BDR6_9ACTN|nr:hypothetical protein [Actinocrinis puniceicyclus]MBS2965558.1 hypothetical protein [Actinocrinis puniceicyclus]